jgi:hypothetical protein
MPLRELMSFVEIRDESFLADYEVFLRKNPATASFVNLVGMTYDNHPKLADRRFNFYLTARRDDIKRVLASLNYEWKFKWRLHRCYKDRAKQRRNLILRQL